MSKCFGTSKTKDTCQEEKMGCVGCAYYSSDIQNLIEELTLVKPSELSEESLKLFKTIMKVLDERDTLIKERDYYKARYLEFNNTFIKK